MLVPITGAHVRTLCAQPPLKPIQDASGEAIENHITAVGGSIRIAEIGNTWMRNLRSKKIDREPTHHGGVGESRMGRRGVDQRLTRGRLKYIPISLPNHHHQIRIETLTIQLTNWCQTSTRDGLVT